ncbi:MAG: PrsW family glutamic-type intramembrane protease [Pseudomonadales bacterium]
MQSNARRRHVAPDTDMILYATLFLGALLASLLIYRYDLYEREPWPYLVATASVGMLTMWLAGTLEEISLGAISDHTFLHVALVAATHEEGLRVAVVGLFALLVPSQFNDPMDGLVYGSFLGIGMAVAESLDRMMYLPALPDMLPATEIVRVFGHLVLGGIVCFGIGLARMRVARWPWWLGGCVVFAVSWHFLWDWVAFTASGSAALLPMQNAVGVVLMATGMVVYGVLVIMGSNESRRIFAPCSQRELWGWPFTLWRGRPGPSRASRGADAS